MLRSILFILAALFVAAAPAPSLALDKGWWVIVGAFPAEPPERQKTDYDRMNAAAKPCRLPLFNDLSGKFRGFAPGLNVFVVGAYASKAQAQSKARAARRCFPGAYVKFGDYAGE